MSIGSTGHSHAASSPLTTLLGASPRAPAKKVDNDADDAVSAQSTVPKLATSGPGQILDRRV